jgi:nicotinamide N-methyltransferase
VVLTDYPDKALLDNLAYNVEQNVQPPPRQGGRGRGGVGVLGYVWGSPVDPLLAALPPDTADTNRDDDDASPVARFDLILLSDLIFNHSQVRHHLPSIPTFFVSVNE